jgi:GDSL-like Lipase/Acylhydrolase family
MPRKAWPLTLATAVAIAAVALTGCKGMSAASDPSTSQTPRVHLYIPSGRYVALGDSFSSGEGVKPFHPETDHHGLIGTPDTCHRSFDAYSQILQAALNDPGAPKPQSEKDFVACSGAKIQALWHWNTDNPSEPPQFDRLNVNAVESNGHAGGPVGLISITMGGNDVGFGPVIKDCVSAIGSCHDGEQHALDVKLHWIDGTYPSNAPAGPGCVPGCNPYKACPPGSGCNPENLVQVYRALRQKAPHARILVLGYPREFRPNTNGLSCQSIDPADQNWANAQLTDAFDAVLQANIKAANAGIEYVPTVSYFQPHEQWCHWRDPDSAFNGIDAKLGTDIQDTSIRMPSASGYSHRRFSTNLASWLLPPARHRSRRQHRRAALRHSLVL